MPTKCDDGSKNVGMESVFVLCTHSASFSIQTWRFEFIIYFAISLKSTEEKPIICYSEIITMKQKKGGEEVNDQVYVWWHPNETLQMVYLSENELFCRMPNIQIVEEHFWQLLTPAKHNSLQKWTFSKVQKRVTNKMANLSKLAIWSTFAHNKIDLQHLQHS